MPDTQTEVTRSLIGEPETFFGSHWGHLPLLTKGGLPATSPFRVSSAELISAVSNRMLRPPFFLMMKDGEPVPFNRITRQLTVGSFPVPDAIDISGVLSELSAGATLTLRAAYEQVPRLAGPFARLATELNGANIVSFLFLTPRDARGFGWHRDAEEVFVVQQFGRKSFELAPSRQKVGEHGRMLDDEPSIADSEVEFFDLEPGDVLYIPSGCPHRARSHDSGGSIHLSIKRETN